MGCAGSTAQDADEPKAAAPTRSNDSAAASGGAKYKPKNGENQNTNRSTTDASSMSALQRHLYANLDDAKSTSTEFAVVMPERPKAEVSAHIEACIQRALAEYGINDDVDQYTSDLIFAKPSRAQTLQLVAWVDDTLLAGPPGTPRAEPLEIAEDLPGVPLELSLGENGDPCSDAPYMVTPFASTEGRSQTKSIYGQQTSSLRSSTMDLLSSARTLRPNEAPLTAALLLRHQATITATMMLKKLPASWAGGGA
jgi:hypothetical protein